MDLRRLEYFLAVAEHGSVTAAAAALHVSQPSLSQSIRALERDLGVELFDRQGRRLTLTGEGKALLDPARRVLDDQAAARAAVGCVVGLTAGWLDVAVHDLLAVELAAVLAAFHRRHAGVPVRVHGPRDEDELIRLVVDGQCEVGIAYLPVHHPGLRVRPLGTHELRVALPPDTSGVADPLPRRALAGMPFVDSGYPAEHTHTVVRTGHPEAVLPLVLAGAGAALVSERYAQEAARAGALVRRLDPPLTADYAVLHRGGALSPAAHRLIKMLALWGR